MAQTPELEGCEAFCVHQDALEQVRLPGPEDVEAMAELFKLFGDPTRLKILCSLTQQELCVCDLAELIGMNQSAVSHQLRLLKQGRLVKSRREGKSIFYSLADSHVYTVLAQGMEHISE
ncbi:MAG: metalloregulator ArsR/SmtB family transcription factor [Oscillospiraceae bacterium]|nr:metalloregulator ArsR/SmtB family transcription factor [Oscillospiraceae bacterium]